VHSLTVAQVLRFLPAAVTVFDHLRGSKGGIPMSRKKKEIPPAKEHFVGVRMTDEMWNVLDKNAVLAGISPSEYIRRLILNQKIVLKPELVFDSAELLAVFRNLGKIGGNLNQIARHLNEGGTFTEEMATEISECITQLHQMRDEVKEMAGEYRGDC
jgi:hypothetical protein